MISNQILQNTIDGLKTIAHVDLCVLDIDYNCRLVFMVVPQYRAWGFSWQGKLL